MKWEYLIINFRPTAVLPELNKLGDEGWEAVTIDPAGWLLLKRPKSN
jgi:hypothetical protein